MYVIENKADIVFLGLSFPDRQDDVAQLTMIDYPQAVLLYELLAGKKPYALGSKTLDEVLKLLTTEEPVSPAVVNRELAGDLDAIILKAMRKEAGERYASAEELSEDLGRFLAGQPILARPVTESAISLQLPMRTSCWGASMPTSSSAVKCIWT